MTGPGRLVAGRYRLRERIGGGGMGAVWLARDERLGRDVAVKQVVLPVGTDPTAAEQQRGRALREGRIAARLSHPHAIAVYDVALEDDQPWLVMEYLPSQSLAAVLDTEGTLRVDQVAQIGAQVADALAATHAAGVVHRDVKPANVLIGRGGRVEGLVKITDFGISHARGDVTLTQTGQITGTPAFLAPEVAQGIDPGPTSDVFSLGATLYTCLEGRPPFGMGENALQQLYRVAAGVIEPPQRCGALTEPLLRMLSADPDARPSMDRVRDDLAALAAGRDGDTTTVLTARTDVAGAGRTPTTSFPGAGAAAVAVESPPTPTPTPPPPSTPPSTPPPSALPSTPARTGGDTPPPSAPPPAVAPRTGRRGRRAPVWWAAAALAAVLVGLLVWALVPGGDSPTASGGAGTPGAESTQQPGEPSPEATQPEDTEPEEPAPTTPEEPPPSDEEISAGDVRGFLRDYHDLVIDDPGEAYALTGPTLQGRVGAGEYAGFWGEFDSVDIDDIQVSEDDPLRARAELEFQWPDGSTQRELHSFTLVSGQDGELRVDVDEVVEVLESRS